MKKIIDNNLQFAIIFLCLIFFLGTWADKNLYKFKFYGEAQSNYEFADTQGDFQTEYTVNFPLKVQMIDANGFVRRIVGQREMNGIVKLKNGYLTAISEAMTDEYVSINAQEIIKYNEYCKEHGITFLYAQPAYKISKWDNQLPIGVNDGHNETVDHLLEELSTAGVNTLDLRQLMHDDGINQYDLYYRTDHHWTTEGAFYAYQKISTWISENTNTYLDKSLLNLDNYQIDTYKKWHLGWRGQKTGIAFAGIDDYDLIYPKFDTSIYNASDQSVKSLKDSLVKEEVFQKRNTQNRYTYDSAYFNSDINVLTSLDAKTDLNVLLLSDSFQLGMKPYMLLTYNKYRVEGYNSLTTSAIEKYQPNVVVIVAWPGYFATSSINFQFVDDAVTEEK